MSLRLGFVGTGKWGRKLAGSFRACGAEIVAHDRRSDAHDGLGYVEAQNEKLGKMHMPVATLEGFGMRRPWRDQLASKDIDAIIAVAPPEVTTEVALECARQGRAVMATKPLFEHPETIRAPFYVDFWRLWGPRLRARDAPIGGTVVLEGSGPFRSFPGMFDYGPHVMAELLTVDPLPTLASASQLAPPMAAEQGELWSAHFHAGDDSPSYYLRFGNGATAGARCIWGHEETPTHIGTEPKDEVIQKMCRSFLEDVHQSYVDTRLLRLSREGMNLLERIRKEPKES